MSRRPPTPEEVICQMTTAEVRELLGDLRMDNSAADANRLQRLVAQLGDFEAAIESIIGPAEMKDAA